MSLHNKWLLHQLPSSLQSCRLRTTRLNRQFLHVKAQSYKDEGRSSNNIVDANLLILSKRIEEVRVKERLERCCLIEHGWNYSPIYDDKHKKEVKLSQLFEIIGLVGGTFSLTILSGTLWLCLASLVIHLNH